MNSRRFIQYLVHAGEQLRRHIETKSLGRPHVKDELEFGRLLDGQICRRLASEDTPDVVADLPESIGKVDAIAHEDAGFGHFARRKTRRYPIACCEHGKLDCATGKKPFGRDEKSIWPFTRKSSEGHVDLSRGAGIEEKNFQPEHGCRCHQCFRCGRTCYAITWIEQHSETTRLGKQFMHESEQRCAPPPRRSILAIAGASSRLLPRPCAITPPIPTAANFIGPVAPSLLVSGLPATDADPEDAIDGLPQADVCVRCSGNLLPPSPPGEKATARQDQAGEIQTLQLAQERKRVCSTAQPLSGAVQFERKRVLCWLCYGHNTPSSSNPALHSFRPICVLLLPSWAKARLLRALSLISRQLRVIANTRPR
jgi:hypothetical protein